MAPEKLAVGGDSAGGGLTVATLVALRNAGKPLPAAGICISPWVDLTLSGESMKTKAGLDPIVTEASLRMMADAYAPGPAAKSRGASPLFDDLEGLPPLLVHVGSAEVLLDDAISFARGEFGRKNREKGFGIGIRSDMGKKGLPSDLPDGRFGIRHGPVPGIFYEVSDSQNGLPDPIDALSDYIDNLPIGADEMPGGKDVLPPPRDEVPIRSDDMPVGSNAVPGFWDGLPTGCDEVSSGSHAMSDGLDELPAGQDGMPSRIDVLPGDCDEVSTESDGVPGVQDAVPARHYGMPVS